MNCNNCNATLEDIQVHWAFDLPYCGDCHSDLFTYCSRCDALIYRSEAHFTEDGEDPFCSECYENDYDDDCPENPRVDESDREFIIRLSRNWLQGKVDNRRLISINDKDYHLQTIKTKVGLIDNPIYVFGLKDRDDYQICASSDLFDEIQKTVKELNLPVKIIQSAGCNRLGINLLFRQSYQTELVQLIKAVTTLKEPALIKN